MVHAFGTLTLLTLIGGMCWIIGKVDDDFVVMRKWGRRIVAGGTTVFLLLWALYFTCGIYPNYGSGIREGYVTKVSRKGFFFKTWEAQIQVGTGEQAALQSPWQFSIGDPALAEKVRDSIGKRVIVSYREWFAMPFRIGETDYEALLVTVK